MASGATTAGQGTGAATLAAMALEAAERYDGAALKYKDGDDWAEMSWEELGKAVREIAAGLIDLGIEPGERVAIISDPSRVDPRRPGRDRGRRGRRPHLPNRLRRGGAPSARGLGDEACVLRGRGEARARARGERGARRGALRAVRGRRRADTGRAARARRRL